LAPQLEQNAAAATKSEPQFRHVGPVGSDVPQLAQNRAPAVSTTTAWQPGHETDGPCVAPGLAGYVER